jgi:hypothetical protein
MPALFQLGRIVITRAAIADITPEDIFVAVRRHAHADWGHLDVEDRQANDAALQDGDRLLSCYRSARQIEFWILTEWDRSVTTILLPSDY